MNENPAVVRDRFKRSSRTGEVMMISSISLFELWFGVANSDRTTSNAKQLADFRSTVELLPFDGDDARTAAYIRADLRRLGEPIGAYDLLIAAQALRHDLLVITADIGAFSRVKGLRWENWEEA